MLTFRRTFRVITRRAADFPTACQATPHADPHFGLPAASPFENPAYVMNSASDSHSLHRPREAELSRAVHPATFPAVD